MFTKTLHSYGVSPLAKWQQIN